MDNTPLAYQHRARPYSPEARFELKPGHVAITQGARKGDFPYRDIVMVRLMYKPRNTTNEGYQAKLYRRDKKTASLTNLSWKSLVDLERLDADYSSFVRELIGRVAAANPGVVLRAGMPTWLHRVTALFGILSVLALFVVAGQALIQGSWPVALLTGALGAYFIWWSSRYLGRNRPRGFSPEAIPTEVVPKG
jgi:hypothetical protein